ncbi:hypothetical protein Hanom_Chr07g00595901 [Helianthus anomalus]
MVLYAIFMHAFNGCLEKNARIVPVVCSFFTFSPQLSKITSIVPNFCNFVPG